MEKYRHIGFVPLAVPLQVGTTGLWALSHRKPIPGQMAPGGSSTSLEIRYSQPEDCQGGPTPSASLLPCPLTDLSWEVVFSTRFTYLLGKVKCHSPQIL